MGTRVSGMIAAAAAVLAGFFMAAAPCGITVRAASVSEADEHLEETGSLEQEIIEAVLFASSLDRLLWENQDSIATKQEVLAHYLQGFSEPLASMFTEYWWWDREDKLLPGDPLLVPPERVHLGSYSEDRAVAYYDTPQILQDPSTWELEPYMEVRLRRDNGRWIIVYARNRNRCPY